MPMSLDDQRARAQQKLNDYLVQKEIARDARQQQRELDARASWEAEAGAAWQAAGGTLDAFKSRSDRLWAEEVERRMQAGNQTLASLRRSGRYSF